MWRVSGRIQTRTLQELKGITATNRLRRILPRRMAKTSRDATAPSPVLRVLRSPAEAPIAPIQAQPVAVLGFGNQGAAHALNLRDSGVEVVVGGRPGRSLERARSLGFRTESLSGAAACSSTTATST